jgi:hypothetical protein
MDGVSSPPPEPAWRSKHSARFRRTVSHRRAAFTTLLLCPAIALAGCGGSGSGGSSGTGGSSGSGTTGTTSTTSTTTTSTAPTQTGPERKVDASRLERAIAISAQAQRHRKAAVICPADVLVATGSSFYCAAQSGGEVTPFLVTEQADGKLAYKGVSAKKAPSVDMAQTEIAIAQTMSAHHQDVRSVSCPQEMPRQQGLEFICVVTTNAKHPTRFIVSETNSLGRVSFKPA